MQYEHNSVHEVNGFEKPMPESTIIEKKTTYIIYTQIKTTKEFTYFTVMMHSSSPTNTSAEKRHSLS